ncbi:MAG: hypothetical protein NE328_19470 [Lentisphaeraceae bacterium]|nr:hypothetical protein [Lentisphaeraceae bacterium]
MIRFLFPLLLVFTSCELIEEYEQSQYPGDYFSRTIAYAKCEKSGDNSFLYELREGVVEVHLEYEKSYILDKRESPVKKILVSSLHHGERIDNSLRYLIREGMNFRQIKQMLGPAGKKWGGVAANMVVWRMADGRYLSIMPSALEMPEGMNSYNVLSEKQKLQKVVKLLPFGAIELKDGYK